MKTRQRLLNALLACGLGLAVWSCSPTSKPPAEVAVEGEEIAVITDAPAVPPPITRKKATKVIVKGADLTVCHLNCCPG